VIGALFWSSAGLVAYAYAGYPLVLAAVARPSRRPAPPAPATPTATLLIAAYNEQDVIARKLENALALDYPRERLQVLVAADGSDDRTAAIVREFADRGVELSHSPPRRGKMAAIERAMARVRGEVVVLSDANNLFAPDALRELVAPFADPTVSAVTGAKLIAAGDGPLGDTEGLYWRYESFIKERETWLGSAAAVAGEILAIRRERFEPVPAGVINEDTYLAVRLIARGGRVVYTPLARSYERVAPSAADERARRARIFAGRWQQLARAREGLPWRRPAALWAIASHQYARTLSGPALAVALAANVLAVVRVDATARPVIARLAPPAGPVLLAGQAAFYAAAVVGRRFDPPPPVGTLVYVPAFLVDAGIASLVGFARFVTSSQTPMWERVARRG
jgi:cellulose synthase/poly-beta-1,6-N-acetylglucosamine synthase-like glycosyltransferase